MLVASLLKKASDQRHLRKHVLNWYHLFVYSFSVSGVASSSVTNYKKYGMIKTSN